MSTMLVSKLSQQTPQKQDLSKVFGNVLTQKVGGWKAKTRKQLVDRITLKFKDFEANYLKHVKKNLRKIADEDVYATFEK